MIQGYILKEKLLNTIILILWDICKGVQLYICIKKTETQGSHSKLG